MPSASPIEEIAQQQLPPFGLRKCCHADMVWRATAPGHEDVAVANLIAEIRCDVQRQSLVFQWRELAGTDSACLQDGPFGGIGDRIFALGAPPLLDRGDNPAERNPAVC